MRYDELDVYKLSHEFVLDMYRVTRGFPSDERYRLIDQIIRASYSIPSNIAEGNGRNTTKDYIKFLHIAKGSANEVGYFLLLSKDLGYIAYDIYKNLKEKLEVIIKMLNALMTSLRKKNEF